jgi:DNA polymerase III delta prime subunit
MQRLDRLDRDWMQRLHRDAETSSVHRYFSLRVPESSATLDQLRNRVQAIRRRNPDILE